MAMSEEQLLAALGVTITGLSTAAAMWARAVHGQLTAIREHLSGHQEFKGRVLQFIHTTERKIERIEARVDHKGASNAS